MIKEDDKKAEDMAGYILPKLDSSYKHVSKIIKPVNLVQPVHYLKSESGLLVLLNRAYTQSDFLNLIKTLNENVSNYGFIAYKDAESYFRSAAFTEKTELKSVSGKKFDDRSLKNYSTEELKQIITLSHPERIMRRMKGEVTYYQPKSERLEEKVITFEFKPVVFNYSHIPKEQRFTLLNVESKQYFIWHNKTDHEGKIKSELKRIRTDKDVRVL